MAATLQKSVPAHASQQIIGKRISELDGVRGCAILLVVLFHCGSFPSTTLPARLLRLATGVSLGWSGVDLFFVLSGFLITAILLDTRGHSHYFQSFYARRVLRIFPLYFAFLAISFWIVLPIAHHFGYGLSARAPAQLWYWLYLSNWRVGLGLTHESFLNHFWSLAIEEQFYLLWPLIVSAFSPKWLLRVCAGIIAGCLILRCSLIAILPAPAIEFLTPFRIDTLAFGALACLALRNPAWSLHMDRISKNVLRASAVTLFVLIFACGAVSIDQPVIRTLGYSAFAAFYASLVLRTATFSGSARWFTTQMRRSWLRNLGQYSYAIYVFHLPVYIVARRVLERAAASAHLHYNALFAFACVALCLAISYGLARLSWRWLEQPFLRRKSLFPYLA